MPKTTVIAPPFDRSTYPQWHRDRIGALMMEAADFAPSGLSTTDTGRVLVLAATMVDAAERRAIAVEYEKVKLRRLVIWLVAAAGLVVGVWLASMVALLGRLE